MPTCDRILVIDDSPLIRTLVEDWLSAAGFVVQLAGSGEEGLEALASSAPTAVLCDLSMPGVSGLDVVRSLKASHPTTPIIMFTESIQLGDAIDAMKLGAFGYVNKGTAEHTVVNELRKAIDQRRMIERNAELEVEARRFEQERDRLKLVEERQLELERIVDEKTRQIAQLEQARGQEDRLTAMGSLVAGIAHEVNNPLAVMKAGMRFLAESLPEALATAAPEVAAELMTTVAEVEDCSVRIQRIIQSVKKLVPDAPTHSSCDPELALEEGWAICRPRVPAGVVVDFDVDGDAKKVALSKDDLALITSNLMLNAAQSYGASDAKGSVMIQVRALEGAVQIEVADTGCGISPEDLPQVCNPFFTTRPPGVGMGLGLSLVHQMVKNASGTMQIDSELGKGTRVKLRIPAEGKIAVARSPAARS